MKAGTLGTAAPKLGKEVTWRWHVAAFPAEVRRKVVTHVG